MTSSFRSIFEQIIAQSTTTVEQGTQFENIIIQYFQKDPKYSGDIEKIWRWNDWPDRTGMDVGVDLVVRTVDDEYWAVQCKCYDPQKKIDKKGVDSFLAASAVQFHTDTGMKSFSQRFFVTTAPLGSQAQRIIKEQSDPPIVLDWEKLEEAPFDWQSANSPEGILIRKQPNNLRPHQEKAIADVMSGFETDDRGQLIMACGTGKTFTSLRLAEQYAGAGGSVLFLVPSISLVSQALREWTAQCDTENYSIKAFVICSDDKVGRGGQSSEDMRVEELAFKATTDAALLATNFAKTGRKRFKVVFSTYHSLAVIHEAQSLHGLPAFDLVICDEAHRTAGVSMLKNKDDSVREESVFVAIHKPDYVVARKRLYMTATPRVYNDKTKQQAADRAEDALLYSMDDETVFGRELHKLSFQKAIDLDLLTDYKVIIVAMDEAEMRARAEVYKDSLLRKFAKSDGLEISASEQIAQKVAGNITTQLVAEIIGAWKALSGVDQVDIIESGKQVSRPDGRSVKAMKRAVAFSTTIARSKLINQVFDGLQSLFEEECPDDIRKFIKVKPDHIDGKMNDRQRRTKLRWLRERGETGGCRLLSNARCLSEGVDVPNLDAVVFFDERKSVIDIVQAVGRVMRKSRGKEYGYIILPVCIPSGEVANYDDYISKDKVFQGIWKIVRALRAHDERFVSNLFFREKIQIARGSLDNGIVSEDTQRQEAPAKQSATDESEQLDLFIRLKALSDAIYTAIPNKLGDKEYWASWTTNIRSIAEIIYTEFEERFSQDENKQVFADFLKSLRSNLNPAVSEREAIEMLSQHAITRPVFETLFPDHSFVQRNPVSQSLQMIIEKLDSTSVQKQIDTLKRFYASVEDKARMIKDDDSGKQDLIRRLYDTFFKEGFPLMAERLGIAYTPTRVVDFILHSTSYVLKNEFSRELGDKNVHIIDPFTGTGTFIVRLLQIKELIADNHLEYKFLNEMHANEIVLLAYYVALVNIESAYHERLPAGSKYESFPGMVLTDSFQLYEDKPQTFGASFLPENSKRAKRQIKAPINVVIGNPPWSIGQRLDNDNNKNIEYPALEARIKATYAKESRSIRKAALYDSYVQAIRWSSDRIGEEGVIALVTNGGWLNGNAGSGLRNCLAKEFDAIWVVNLRGDARTSGELRRKEKDNVFGQSTRTPVTLIILAKNPNNRRKTATIFYHDIGNYLSAEGKLDILSNKRSIAGLNFQTITPDKDNDWINQRDRRFDKFIEMGSKQVKAGTVGFNPTVFQLYSLGVATNRDAWVYNFSREGLTKNMGRMIEFYNQQIDQPQNQNGSRSNNIDNFTVNDPKKISWDRSLRNSLVQNTIGKFSSENIRNSLYRPFIQQYLYFDRQFNGMVYRQPNIFPTPDSENQAIVISSIGAKEFSVLMTKYIPNLHFMDTSQCFPRYAYDNHGEKIDNIAEAGVLAFRKHYNENSISNDDIFYYTYGLLHSPDYREAFASNLTKQLPRLPYAKDFHAFSKAGKKLATLHADYETATEYPLTVSDSQGNSILGDLSRDANFYQVKKMKWVDKAIKSCIIYNDHISLDGIPPEATRYIVNGRTPLDWIIDRYQLKIDKASGIKNDPNQWSSDPRYIINLIKRLTQISIETTKIINSLPSALE